MLSEVMGALAGRAALLMPYFYSYKRKYKINKRLTKMLEEVL